MFKNKKNRLFKGLIITFSIIFVFIIIFVIYVSDYYHADELVIEAYTKDFNVEKKINKKGITSYIPESYDTGFIFYPGGKVESTSYEALIYDLASKGILCILIDMPFNLAVFGINKADDVFDYYPNIDKWYIGGHSLGGSMAASYLDKNSSRFNGLILLGSYSTYDLTDNNIEVLSIYGSFDNVLNKDKYNENKDNLPDGYKEVIIEGGCHAYFGMYGNQKGDGTPTITAFEQISLTSDYIFDFVND